MEGKIPMTARRHVTNKLHTAYRKASKTDRGRILDEVIATTGMGRSTARRMLTGPVLPNPNEQVDKRRLRPKTYSDDSRALLEHVWALMGMPCGKYLVVMLPLWLPLLDEAGDLDHTFATPETIRELESMSPATIDRYLLPARQSMRLRGITTTTPSPLLRNSIGLSKVGDEPPTVPGVIEADTVAHCGPTFVGEFVRTLTMTDLVTGWTENASIRNNAAKWIVQAVGDLQEMFPFPLSIFDSDNGSEFINHEVADWLQERDIAQTRSRPYKKNDQATVESKNNHIVRKHAFYWRYDTSEELELLGRLWPVVSMLLNFFTPTKKPVGYSTTADGRRRRVYDKPATPWNRVLDSGLLTTQQTETIQARIIGVNPADLTRQINQIQMSLIELAQGKTESMAAARHLNMAALESSMSRLQRSK
ncbi:DDE-type integrase/transposase/recombinase [Brevibacterium spongiae]|uniref:DDE-type integrase/transposase/recombinase n=1 Tax=Brevibacterium spongiae TaxID=2909672 RepID=A0ABY5STP1_9MICO|nr:DDE-type integrase/transposase/recombinase [Brevibacterium spongiae]UVI36429.1 DDE-type integrase/transposase/recombinase [Brevibacterium spongiae]UVI36619.1 DDE-type integrase/transposase/recombinase [Brevibacterium spongiae]